ncbi:MAG: VWA domain-containing protein, partial [Dehalococcoidia bacterium]|nr:VWA domain-containing protein [Dehalococcoidia bacterium]
MRNRIVLLVVCLTTMVALTASAVDNLVFILDASNSMNKTFGEDTRLNVAKDALIDLLEVVGTLDQAGLFVYGHRVDKDDEAASCLDIEALFPALPDDAADSPTVIDAILGLQALG